MSKDISPGLTPVGLLIFATALSSVVTIGIPYILDKEPIKSSDWLGFAGAFLGAMVALIAAAYAWRGVQVQIAALQKATSLALIGREEERLEAELPGLKDTQTRLKRWIVNLEVAVNGLRPEVFVALLKQDGIGKSKDDFGNDRMVPEDIDRAFPNTSLPLRNKIFEELRNASTGAEALALSISKIVKARDVQPDDPNYRRLTSDVAIHEQLLKDWGSRMDTTVEALHGIIADIEQRIALIESRLPHFRKIIEDGLK